jgi:hypothetical protein
MNRIGLCTIVRGDFNANSIVNFKMILRVFKRGKQAVKAERQEGVELTPAFRWRFFMRSIKKKLQRLAGNKLQRILSAAACFIFSKLLK